jgi:hypothetical protein
VIVGEGTQGTGTGPAEPDDPDDEGGGDEDGREDDEPPNALEELEEGRVDPRLLQPDPGETRADFEARLLAVLLDLDELGGGGGVEAAGPVTGPDLTPPDAGLGPDGPPGEAPE